MRLAPRSFLALSVACGALSCSAQSFVAVLPKVVVNDVHNRTLRRDVLSLGAGDICKELMKRTIPLKLGPDDPAIGRFFPDQCEVKRVDNGDFYVKFGGSGYAWSNVTRRIGFSATAAIEYDQDFRLDGSTAYVYFRPASFAARSFEPLMVELEAFPPTPLSPVLVGGTPQGFVRQVGPSLFDFILSEGFTVIRDSDGYTSFAIGTLEPGERPIEPYERTNRARDIYTNERIELHQGERDFIGPITVASGSAIYLTVMVDGAQQVDVQLHPREAVDPWLKQYLTSRQSAAATAAPLFHEAIPAGPAPARRAIRVPAGSYYVVLESPSPPAALDDRVALVNIGIETGAP